jgi:hypothetical protein
MSYHAFEPTPRQFIDRVIERSQGMVSTDGGDARYRVIHQTHRTTEFEGPRDDCIAFVERAWWLAATASSPRGESQGGDYAVALAFDRWNGAPGRWQHDRFLTDALLRGHF